MNLLYNGLVLLSLSTPVFAQTQALREGVSDLAYLDTNFSVFAEGIEPGQYVSRKPNYFRDVTIKNWADELIIAGIVTFGPGNGFEFQGPLLQNNEDTRKFTSDAAMIQEWSDGMRCSYPIKLEIIRIQSALFVKSYLPTSTMQSRPPGSSCPSYSQYYGWIRHDDPYNLVIE